MALKYTGDSILGVSLTVETPKPLDTRTVVSHSDDLYTIDPKYAYEGMLVADIDSGNTYMLVDKSNIDKPQGWKASYEAILIITCTELDYKKWQSNTTEDFKPIEPDLPYLHAETYYYIYEDSLDNKQFYLSASWGDDIVERLNLKASLESLLRVKEDLNLVIDNYTTLDEVSKIYVPITDLDLENPESFLSKTLSSYYTKIETDDIFVTKESLRGEGLEGDNFVFVTLDKYEEDLQLLLQVLALKVETDSEALLSKLNVPEISYLNNSITFTEEGAALNGLEIAKVSLIPVILVVTKEDYDKLVENTNMEDYTPINPDEPCLVSGVYYYVINETVQLVTTLYLTTLYSTTTNMKLWVIQEFYRKTDVDEIIRGLEERISALEASNV